MRIENALLAGFLEGFYAYKLYLDYFDKTRTAGKVSHHLSTSGGCLELRALKKFYLVLSWTLHQHGDTPLMSQPKTRLGSKLTLYLIHEYGKEGLTPITTQ